MVRLIALRGKISGSVVLKSSGGRTEFTLRTRRSTQLGSDGLSAYLIAPDQSGGFRMERADIASGAGGANIDGVRGIFITGGAAIIAEGASGMSDTALERAKVKLRLELSQNGGAAEPSRAQGRGGFTASGKSEGTNSAAEAFENASAAAKADKQILADGGGQEGVSPVTRRILSQAKALFGSGDADAFLFDEDAEPDKASGEASPEVEPYMPDSEAVKNPFPALFPNSSWRKKAGEAALSGKVKHRGRLYAVAAVPREGRFPPNELSPFSNIRTARAEDGKMYWLGIKRL